MLLLHSPSNCFRVLEGRLDGLPGLGFHIIRIEASRTSLRHIEDVIATGTAISTFAPGSHPSRHHAAAPRTPEESARKQVVMTTIAFGGYLIFPQLGLGRLKGIIIKFGTVSP